jgi:peptidoglycan/xylan/chitin deacetylase (PgdA/CDA1 family)
VYHKVSPDPHPFFEPVAPGRFRQHMDFLKRYYSVMDLRELVERSAAGDVPARAVAITFDDGYRDNYEYAFPILKEYGLPATIFVATGTVGNQDVLWHDRVFDSFRYTARTSARLSSGAGIPELALDSEQARSNSLGIALRKAKTLWGESRRRFVEQVEDALRPDIPEHERERMLSWDQIREMHSAGIRFGSHTVTHPVLSALPRAELIKELGDSRENLSRQLKTTVDTFAYPNGKAADYNEEVKSVLKECGYICAVTMRSGVNRSFADPYELRRDLPWDKEIDLFRLRFFLQRHDLRG